MTDPMRAALEKARAELLQKSHLSESEWSKRSIAKQIDAALSTPLTPIYCTIEKKMVREKCNATCVDSLGCGPPPTPTGAEIGTTK